MDKEKIIDNTMVNVHIFIEYLRIYIREKNDKNVRFEVSESTFSNFQSTAVTKEKLNEDGEIYYLIYIFHYTEILNVYIYHDGFKYSNDKTPDKFSELIVVMENEIQLSLDSIN
jgi:hypothetical protein